MPPTVVGMEPAIKLLDTCVGGEAQILAVHEHDTDSTASDRWTACAQDSTPSGCLYLKVRECSEPRYAQRQSPRQRVPVQVHRRQLSQSTEVVRQASNQPIRVEIQQLQSS